MKKTLTIEKCIECKYCTFKINNLEHKCRLIKPNRVLNDVVSIPEWCKLKDAK